MAAPHVVVVGAGMSGLRSAEQLRSAGHAGPLTLLGEEPHMPYNRPPLSKSLLADSGESGLQRLHGLVAFRKRASVGDVGFRLDHRVVASDLGRRTVTLEDGEVAEFDGLVVASGLRPRRLSLPGPRRGRQTLRTLDDCIGLRQRLSGARDVVVLGAGFIGCEVACTAHELGARVTVVDPLGPPMVRVLGGDLADAVRRHHEAAGIGFLPGRTATTLEGEDAVTGVRLDDDRVLPADVVVEAVGSVPNTEWLAGNGIDLSDGVLCDNHLSVGGRHDVVTVGDVARFPNPLLDTVPRRVEHWAIPTDTAKRAARTLVSGLAGDEPDPTPFAPVPTFWSDQRDLRLQSFGSPELADASTVEEGDPGHLPGGVLLTYTRGGAHVGTVAVNLSPARYRGLREDVAALTPDSPPPAAGRTNLLETKDTA